MLKSVSFLSYFIVFNRLQQCDDDKADPKPEVSFYHSSDSDADQVNFPSFQAFQIIVITFILFSLQVQAGSLHLDDKPSRKNATQLLQTFSHFHIAFKVYAANKKLDRCASLFRNIMEDQSGKNNLDFYSHYACYLYN